MAINLTGKADATIASAALQAGKAGVPTDLSTTFKVMSDSYATGMGKVGAGLAKVAEVAAKQGAKLAKKAIDDFKAPPVEDLEMMSDNMGGTLLNDIAELKEERKGMLKFWDKKDDPTTEIDEGRMSWKEYKKRKKEISDEVASFQANKTAIVEGINNGTFDTGASDNYNMLLAETFMSEDGVIAEGDHAGVYAKHVKMPDGKYAWKLYDKDNKEISGVNQDDGSLQYLDGSDVAVRFQERQAGELEDARKATQELQTDAYKDFDPTITKPDNVVAGVVNDDVRAMQNKLKAAGYDLPKFGVDGKWGPETEKAWNDYSSKLGLYNDLKAKAEDYVPGTTTERGLPEGFDNLNQKEQYAQLTDILKEKYPEAVDKYEDIEREIREEARIHVTNTAPDLEDRDEVSRMWNDRVRSNMVAALKEMYPDMSDEEVLYLYHTDAGGREMEGTSWSDADDPNSPQNALIASYGVTGTTLDYLTSQIGKTADIPDRQEKFVRSKDIGNLLVPNAETTLAAWQQLEIDVLTGAQEGAALREHELRNNLRKAINTPEKMAYMVNQPIGNMEFSYKEQLSMPSRISAEMWTAINDIAGEELSALDTDGVPGLTEADFENNLENFKILREAMLNFDDPSAKEIFVEWYAQDITRSHGELFDQWVASQQADDDGGGGDDDDDDEEVLGYNPTGAWSQNVQLPGGTSGTVDNQTVAGLADRLIDIQDGNTSTKSFFFNGFDYVWDHADAPGKWSRMERVDDGTGTGNTRRQRKVFKDNNQLFSGQGLAWSGTPWLMDIIEQGGVNGGGGGSAVNAARQRAAGGYE